MAPPGDIAALLETRKMGCHVGMTDRVVGRVGLQVAFGYVCSVSSLVHQKVIPGPVFGRARAGHGVVPFFATLKDRVHVEDNAAVGEQPVMYQLADPEFPVADFIVHNRPITLNEA